MLGPSLLIRNQPIFVIDRPETIAAELQVIGHEAGPSVAEIKCLLLVKRRTRIGYMIIRTSVSAQIETSHTIGDRHITERYAIKEWTPIV
jgi:hypothetical protein